MLSSSTVGIRSFTAALRIFLLNACPAVLCQRDHSGGLWSYAVFCLLALHCQQFSLQHAEIGLVVNAIDQLLLVWQDEQHSSTQGVTSYALQQTVLNG